MKDCSRISKIDKRHFIFLLKGSYAIILSLTLTP